jgi:hypothetical protein
MTLSARIKLIDDMVRENPDTTIKDYLELVRDIKEIRAAANDEEIIVPVISNPLRLPRKKRSPNKVSGKYTQTYKLNFGR